MITKTCVILCGGKGTRLYGNGALQSKPLTLLGDKPILEHLVDYMIRQGFDDFILLCGFLIDDYKKWINNKGEYYSNKDIKINIVDTGADTATGERILRAKDYIKNDFILTYGDGLADIDFVDMEKYLRECDTPKMIVTVIHPPARFGVISLTESSGSRVCIVSKFNEKPNRSDWINGGFIFCSRIFIDYIQSGDTFERETIKRFMNNHNIYAYKHTGNWECLDTPADLEHLEHLWNNNLDFWSGKNK
jgi:glucose-1-phosphate cytidylyltransferase